MVRHTMPHMLYEPVSDAEFEAVIYEVDGHVAW